MAKIIKFDTEARSKISGKEKKIEMKELVNEIKKII